MALQRVPNRVVESISTIFVSSTQATADAAGESCAVIGYVVLENGTASTKTISSSGGAIHWRVGTAITFANGGTNLRIGIQDVSTATGLEDGTYDVQADLVGGTDTVTASTYLKTAMESGTKTLTHGDLIALVWETTARAGADSVTVGRVLNPVTTIQDNIPYGTADTGAGPVKTSLLPFAMIEFDDGTVGWIMGMGAGPFGRGSVNFNSSSTPDEYAAVWTPAYTCEIDGVGLDLSSIASTDNYEVVLYSDPLGTPAVLVTLTPDPDQIGATSAGISFTMYSITPTTLTAGVTYGVALRPTTVNNVTIGYVDYGSGLDKLKRMSGWGSTLKLASRTNQTGAFTEVQTYQAPYLWLRESKLDDGRSARSSLLLGI